MATIEPSTILSALAGFTDPETGRSVTQMEQVRDVQITGGRLSLTLGLTTHSAPLWQETKAALEQFLRGKFPQLQEVNVNLAMHPRPAQQIGTIGVTAKSVIAVGSGKGGVGKSTIA